MWKLHRLLIYLTLIATVPAWGVTPYLVRDINPEVTPASSEPHGLGSLGSLALFTAAWPAQGTLWRSDGTAGGTYPLLEAQSIELLALTADRCFFLSSQREVPGWLLWVIDGTLPGTVQLTEPGLRISNTYGRSAWVPRQRALYFAAGDPSHGLELWRTDGTPGGTYQVADIWPGSSDSSPSALTSFKGNVYFVARDPDQGPALWRSDGTAGGTVLVRDTAPDSTRLGPGFLHSVGSRLIFVGSDRDHGTELWTSDGTAAGTEPAGPDFWSIEHPAVHGGQLWFLAWNGGSWMNLWSTDGTTGGTRQRVEMDPGRGSFHGFLMISDGVRLYLSGHTDGGFGLWVSDGTAAGTRKISDAYPGSARDLALFGGRLYFAGSAGSPWRDDLYVTDGTEAGTHPLHAAGGRSLGPVKNLLPLGNHLLLITDRGEL